MSERDRAAEGNEEGAYAGLGGAWGRMNDPSSADAGAGALNQSGSGGVGGSLGEAAESPLGMRVDTSGASALSDEDALDIALGGTPAGGPAGDLGTGMQDTDADDPRDASVRR